MKQKQSFHKGCKKLLLLSFLVPVLFLLFQIVFDDFPINEDDLEASLKDRWRRCVYGW